MKYAKIFRAGAFALAATFPLASTPTLAANLFEALFGRGPSIFAPAPRYVVLPRYEPGYPGPRRAIPRKRAKVSPAIRTERGKPQIAKAALTPEEEASPLAPFLRDSTLRKGDAVVTAKGVYVYAGRAGRPSLADFQPFDAKGRSAGMNSSTRAALANVQQGNRYASNGAVVAQREPVMKTAPVDREQAPRIVASDRRAGVD